LTAAGVASLGGTSTLPIAVGITAAGNVATGSGAAIAETVTIVAAGVSNGVQPGAAVGGVRRPSIPQPIVLPPPPIHIITDAERTWVHAWITASGTVGVSGDAVLALTAQTESCGDVGVYGDARLVLTSSFDSRHDRHQMISDNELRRMREDYELALL
jgi:hypothetical protein